MIGRQRRKSYEALLKSGLNCSQLAEQSKPSPKGKLMMNGSGRSYFLTLNCTLKFSEGTLCSTV